MRVHVREGSPLGAEISLLAIGLPEDASASEGFLQELDTALGGAVARVLGRDFRGKKNDELVLYREGGGPERVVLLGLGPAGKVELETLRRMAGRAVRAAERLRSASVSLSVDAALFAGGPGAADVAKAFAEGAVLASWNFREFKTKEPEEGPDVDVTRLDIFASTSPAEVAEAARQGSVIAAGENLARTFQARPGNVATPTHLAEEARALAEEHGLAVTIFDEAAMKEAGMEAILAVSAGSREEARLIVLEHRGGEEGDPPLVLVGKGLTFDAGGISLKPPAGMEEMKFDMSGGAAVLGAMTAIARLGVAANVVGIVPSSENLPSGTAVKPGDIIGSLAGKTIEVINTDAEGRLILADALAYGAGLEPAAMVDCATLTGAVVIGLGHHASAVLGNDDGLVAELQEAGERTGERCWPLPLWEEYTRQLDSEFADLLNVGGRPAGTITAAAFLKEFVGDAPWAHLDIAGTAYGDKPLPYQRKGGYGVPTRLLVDWVQARAG
ncbi:MAG: leucyl aminopeptidase [Gemmatimonadota bacterium]